MMNDVFQIGDRVRPHLSGRFPEKRGTIEAQTLVYPETSGPSYIRYAVRLDTGEMQQAEAWFLMRLTPMEELAHALAD